MKNSLMSGWLVLPSINPISFATRLYGRVIRASRSRMITIFFRYDDYGDLSPQDIEENVILAFIKNDIPCTVGVIPFYIGVSSSYPNALSTLSTRKVEFLKSITGPGVIELALHGYSHTNIRNDTDPWFSEFYSQDLHSQLEKISDGKRYLEDTLGVDINTFIPPWNTYDLNTLSAIEQRGFKCISADMYGQSTSNTLLKFIPATVELHELRQAIEKARMLPDKYPVIVTLIHPYDFLESGIFNFVDLFPLLEWVRGQQDIQIFTISQALQFDIDLTLNRFNTYKAYLTRSYVIPQFLRLPLDGIYPSVLTVQLIKKIGTALTALLFLTVFLFSMGITSWLQNTFSLISEPILIAYQGSVTIIMLLLSLYALRKMKLGFKGATVVAATAGALLGIWIT
jgi:peptidoglycan/xylan/chitin deacetylase (PgdA/CDA1 family)